MRFGLLALLSVVGVDTAPVLRPDIAPLSVSLGGIVSICELLQQLLVAHYAGVKSHLNQQNIVYNAYPSAEGFVFNVLQLLKLVHLQGHEF